jgi:hypothetical protein
MNDGPQMIASEPGVESFAKRRREPLSRARVNCSPSLTVTCHLDGHSPSAAAPHLHFAAEYCAYLMAIRTPHLVRSP